MAVIAVVEHSAIELKVNHLRRLIWKSVKAWELDIE